MNEIGNVAVIDIGKTNAKVALVALANCVETVVLKQPSIIAQDGDYPHHDVGALWSFITQSLRKLNETAHVDAISVTTHGATAALVDASGNLALPILDYEFDGFGEYRDRYNKLHPKFSETGSPRLPMGLNLGMQIFWQQQKFPDAFRRVAKILMYPQYWAYRLTGIACNEVTSLGCHTDLWSPVKNDYSSLVDQLHLRPLMAPLRGAFEILGPISSAVAQATGLGRNTQVGVGIHDSNASLVPHLTKSTKAFSVVSSGTWVVAMAIGADTPMLDENRDCLLNINARGEMVPSARFMGGREFQVLAGDQHVKISDPDISAVLEDGVFLLPSVSAGSGPFPDRQSNWVGSPNVAQRNVAASFYLAMMTATCLQLIGAKGDIIVEGPFSENDLYLKMLSAATGLPIVADKSSATGTTIGAAMLFGSDALAVSRRKHSAAPSDQSYVAYARKWLKLVAS